MSYITEITYAELDWDTEEVDKDKIQEIINRLGWDSVLEATDNGVINVIDGVFNVVALDNMNELMNELAKAGVHGEIRLSGEEAYDFEAYELDGEDAVHKVGHVVWEEGE